MPRVPLTGCSLCGDKPRTPETFFSDSQNADRLESRCKECNRQKSLTYYHRNKDRARNNELKRNYGITLDEYREMIDLQLGLCAVCGKLNGKKQLVVDHDHDTGAIRGLLCTGCNAAIGLLGDSSRRLFSAARYLEGAENA